MKAGLIAGVLASALASGVGCGGSPSSFPDETECPVPAPLATSRAAPGAVSPNAYLQKLQAFASTLEKLRADLRAKYPEDTFYRREEFRPDFAAYASQTVCTAQSMFDLDPPDARFTDYDATIDALVRDLIEHTRAGREAVRSRNVSEYRDWYEGADTKILAVRNAANLPPR